VAVNAADGVRVIGRRDEGSRKIVPPSKADVRKLIEAAAPDFRVKLIFAAATGVRAGEFHALRWRHIDFAKGEVTIEARLDQYKEEGPPKTAAGVRTIPLAKSVAAELKRWRLRSSFSRDDDYVFPNGKGRPERHNVMLRGHFRPLCKRAGVARVNWHGLRHFAISCWIEQRLAPKTVQTFAGHSSLAITMDRYGHLFPSEDHRTAMDNIAGALFG
jgi:integrase